MKRLETSTDLSEYNKKPSFWALLPILIFLILFTGMGMVTGDFYTVPAVVGFLIALLVAFVQNRNVPFAEKIKIVSNGMADESIITMLFVFIMAGAFSGIVKAAGGVESTVNFGLSIIPSRFVIIGIFIVGCFISLSMGTSMGTIASLAPIAVGVSEKTGLSLPLCISAVVCGAMFGDNLSIISDTTIAAVKTQGCEMKDKFKQNFIIVLPAAIITVVILAFRTLNANYSISGDLEYNIFKIVPYIIVLAGALIGFNVFAVLLAGIVSSALVGIIFKSFTFVQMFSEIGKGIESMYEITVISIIVAAIFNIVKSNGGVQYIIDLINKNLNSKKKAELGIAGISALVDCCTANNTVAIVMSGPIAKEIGDEFEISPKKTASILDIFTSTMQGIIPYGAQLLTAASISKLTPFQIIPNLYYPVLMGLSGLIFIIFLDRK